MKTQNTYSNNPSSNKPVEKIKTAFFALSRVEYAVFLTFSVAALISLLIIILQTSKSFLVEIPSPGGTIKEGLIGTPRFINPILELSDADRDLTTLVYSGLMRSTSYGNLIPDLAKSYTISADGKIYTFILKENIFFHDGSAVTVDDIIYTIEKAQDPLIKSPKRANWEGVTMEKVSDREINFILKQPYAPFIENTTLGILPKHIWKDTDAETFSFSQLNYEPVGAGPYRIKTIKTNESRVPVIYYLAPFKKYTLGKPYIKNLIIKLYPSELKMLNAYEKGGIDTISAISPEYAGQVALIKNAKVETTPLPRIFGVFFNQNQASIFTNAEIREALDISAPREEIVKKVLYGYGSLTESPIPSGLLPPLSLASSTVLETDQSTSTPLEKASRLLEKKGWELDEKSKLLVKKTKSAEFRFEFSIATANVPDLKRAAEILKTEWEKLGAKIEIRTFDLGDLNQSVIRPRKYDALLFGEIVGRDLDLFAFWHSSQRNDPGLNIALYTNSKVDKLLEDVRTISSMTERTEKYREFEKEIKKDVPAVFIYSPDFIYLIPPTLKGFTIKNATVPSERFENIHEWHIKTDTVWKIFAKDHLTLSSNN